MLSHLEPKKLKNHERGLNREEVVRESTKNVHRVDLVSERRHHPPRQEGGENAVSSEEEEPSSRREGVCVSSEELVLQASRKGEVFASRKEGAKVVRKEDIDEDPPECY